MLSEVDVVLFTLIGRMIKFLDGTRIEKQVRELVRFSPYQLEHFLDYCGLTGMNITRNQRRVKKTYVLYLPQHIRKALYQDEGRLVVFYCEDDKKKGGLTKVCYTRAEFNREMACASRDEQPVLRVRRDGVPAFCHRTITQRFASPAAKLLEFMFGFDCVNMEQLTQQCQLMVNMSYRQLAIINTLWSKKNNILPWEIVCLQSKEQLAKRFEGEKEGTVTILAIRMVPGLMVFEWRVDKRRGLEAHNPSCIRSIYEFEV